MLQVQLLANMDKDMELYNGRFGTITRYWLRASTCIDWYRLTGLYCLAVLAAIDLLY